MADRRTRWTPCSTMPQISNPCSFLNGNRIRRVDSRGRILPLPQPSHHGRTKRDNVDVKNRQKQPSPSDHPRDAGADIVPHALLCDGEPENRIEPVLRRPFVLEPVFAFIVGRNGYTDQLPCCAVGDDEDEDECG